MRSNLYLPLLAVSLSMSVGAQTAVTTGGGTVNSVPVFTGTATLGNSPISISSGHIGIGTTSPAQALEVNGSVQVDGSLIIPYGPGTISVTNTGTSGNIFQANFPYLAVGGSVSESLGYNFGGANYYDSGVLSYVYSGGANSTSNYLGLFVYAAPSGLIVNGLGNVGIGTTTPGSRLEIDGSVKLTAGSGASVTYQDGSVQTVAWNGVLGGGDYAESVDVSGDRTLYEPGDVLVIDSSAEGKFLRSSQPYSTAVMGIYSTNPGVVGRRQTTDKSHMKAEVPMAMVGVVPTKVNTEGGAIKPGDLLVTSSTPGYAMRGSDRSQLTGAIIGKALGHLDAGKGVIEVAVSIQ